MCATLWGCSLDRAGLIDESVDAGQVDGGRRDAGSVDSGTRDAGAPDAGSDDGGPGFDAGTFDAGTDAGTFDAGTFDAGTDAGTFDAGTDAGTFDAGTDAGRPWTVDLSTAGTFARRSEGSYLTGAPSDARAFVAWAAVDQRRLEDRGDGAGPLLLIEGQATNFIRDSREVGTSRWGQPGSASCMIAGTREPGPDGTASAQRVSGIGYPPGQDTGTSSVARTLSAWGRSPTMSPWNANYAYGNLMRPAWALTATSAWIRPSATGTPTAAGVYYPVDTTIPGGLPGPISLVLDLHQLEDGRFPTSAIRSGSSTATREQDRLLLTASDLDARFFTASAGFTEVSPVFATADLVAGDEFWLVSVAAADGVRIRNDGTGVFVELVSGGAVMARSAPLSFTRHARLGPVCWDPTSRTLSVGPTSGPPGTAWSWTSASVRVGARLDGAFSASARLGNLYDCR